MRRWLLRLLMLVLALAALAAGAFEVLRHTDVPRRLVADALRGQTGLRVELGSLQLNWTGDTRLENLTLRLPLEEREGDPLLRAPALRLKHTGVMELLLRLGAVRVESAELDRVRLHLRQRETGRWNATEAIGLLQQPEDPDAKPIESLALPRLDIRELTVRVTDATGWSTEVGPVHVEGRPTEGAAWTFEAGLPGRFEADGHLMTRGNWQHRVRLSLEDPAEDPLLRRWWENPPETLGLECIWEGRSESGSLAGRLEVERLRAWGYEAHGPIRVDVGDGRLRVEPAGLMVAEARDEGRSVRLTGGQVDVLSTAVQAERVQVRGLGIDGRLSGRWSLEEPAGRVEAAWSGRSDGLIERVRHEGTLEASYHRPTPGEHRFEATINSEGQAPEGRWTATVRAESEGPALRQMAWQLTVPDGHWRGKGQPALVLSGAEASGTLNWPTAELTELTLPDTARVDAALRADFEKESWTAGFEADRWALPWLDGRKLDVAFSAEGDAERIDVRSLTAAVEELSLTASGGYVFEREEPISAELELTFARGLSAADADAEANGSDGGSGSGGATRWGGRGRWTGTVTGSLEPRSVEARGELRLDRLLVGRQTMEDVQFPMHATWTTRLLSVESEWFDLLEGRCSFAGTYNPVERDLRVTLDTEGVSLGRVATLANPNLRIEGAMDAEVNLSLPGLSQERMELSGDWEVRDFRADPVTVDQADGRFRTRGRMLRLEPIRLRKGEGRAEGRVVFNLRDGRTVRAELRGDDWPVHLDRPRLDAVADGRLHNMTVDVIDRQVQGDLDLSVDVDLRGESLGRVTVRGGLSERALTLEHVEANLLGGSVDGRAKLVFDPWHESTGEFSLHELHLAELKPWAQAGERISGAVSGEVTVEPSRSRRAPEPMKITARLSPVGARVLRLPVGETTLTAYAGRRRLLLDESRIQAAEGEVSLWVSLTRHAGDEWYTHVQSRLDALNLDVINQAFKEEPEPMPGRLSGRMSVVGPVGDWHAAVGQGNLELTESDLVNNPIIGSVYDALRLTAPSLDPTGKGSIRLRLDQGALHLSRISYFNHGIDFYGNLVVEDLAAGQNSALTGTVLGSVRPLKNLDLPGTGTFDRLLHSLQSAVSTFRVSGTLNEPKVTAASLDWAARTLRRLILNEREQQFESGATPVP